MSTQLSDRKLNSSDINGGYQFETAANAWTLNMVNYLVEGVLYADGNSDTAIATANAAETNSETAVATATSANATATSANTKSDNAVATANNAYNNATDTDGTKAIDIAKASKTESATALSNSSQAVTTSNTANAQSSNAVSTANSANTKSDTALSTANSAKTIAQTAETNSETATATATSANTTANSANTKSDSAVLTATTANTTANKALSIVQNITAEEVENGGAISAEIVTLANDNLKLVIKNAKGDVGNTGATGAAAGFGTPTASATTLEPTQSATASVTASGTNISKVFAFNFGLPKGLKGDTGAKGDAGEEVQLRVSAGYFQWKYTNDTTWTNLIAVSEIATVDTTLSTTSTNAIANNAVATSLALKQDTNISGTASVPTTAWVADTTYADYGFRASVTIANVTATMQGQIAFDDTSLALGILSSNAKTYAGGVYIYASEVPSEAVSFDYTLFAEVE